MKKSRYWLSVGTRCLESVGVLGMFWSRGAWAEEGRRMDFVVEGWCGVLGRLKTGQRVVYPAG